MRRLLVVFVLALTAVAIATLVIPQQFTVFRGKLVSGNIASVFESDDDRLVVMGGPTVSTYDAPLDVRFTALCSTDQPRRLLLTMETRANTPGLTQYVDMFEWASNQWVTLDERAVTMSDSTTVIDIPTCWRFAKPGTGQMNLRFWAANRGPVAVPAWTIGIDKLIWDVDPQ